tara:strand:- start:1596 stop:2195 length:600 start_codon:yes stop_codon:yes gene_type:complete
MPDYYVYLKTGKHSGNDGATINTIPLRATSVSVSTSKTIPSMQVPLSGLVTGESETVALDIGMAGKNISINGFIVDGPLTRHGSTVNMTSQEIAQLIHSSVDSTGVAQNQAIVELVFLIESKVDRNYNEVTKRNIPFTYHARGGNNLLDNLNVPFRTEFPDAETDDGLKGFIRQFNTTFTSDTVEIEFQLDFEIARILP